MNIRNHEHDPSETGIFIPQDKLDELLEQAHSDRTKIEHFVDSLGEVPGLCEALVHRANSPEFALRKQVSRVEHAIAVLGIRRTADTISGYATTSRSSSASGVASPHFLDKTDNSTSTPGPGNHHAAE